MERRGHARRRPHPRDGRATLVTLTTAGLGAHREANRRFEAAYRAFLEALPHDEVASRSILMAIRTAAIEAATFESAEPS
jgi:DNA-binding MarR family transcriptional regulator